MFFRYHLRTFQQFPHQILGSLNRNKQVFGRSTPDYESGHEDCKILTFKVNSLCQKSSQFCQKKNSLKNIKSGAQLIIMTLFVYCHFEALYLLRLGSNFKP